MNPFERFMNLRKQILAFLMQTIFAQSTISRTNLLIIAEPMENGTEITFNLTGTKDFPAERRVKDDEIAFITAKQLVAIRVPVLGGNPIWTAMEEYQYVPDTIFTTAHATIPAVKAWHVLAGFFKGTMNHYIQRSLVVRDIDTNAFLFKPQNGAIGSQFFFSEDSPFAVSGKQTHRITVQPNIPTALSGSYMKGDANFKYFIGLRCESILSSTTDEKAARTTADQFNYDNGYNESENTYAATNSGAKRACN